MPRYLLDTNILIRWRLESKKLTKEQHRVLQQVERWREPVAISAISLWEVAATVQRGAVRMSESLSSWLAEVESDPLIEVLPITVAIAIETTTLGRSYPSDPGDRIIAATARCHGLKLLTSDQRIRDSGIVAVV